MLIKLAMVVVSLLFIRKRSKRYLQYLQQEEYHVSRFFQWLMNWKAWDRLGSGSVLLAGLLSWFSPIVGSIFGIALLGAITQREPNSTRDGKISLKLTIRAQRIHRTALLLLLLVYAIVLATVHSPSLLWLAHIPLFQLIPFSLIGAVQLLQGHEEKVQQRLIAEAKARLRQIDPLVIGITGSYGKTSTKNALGELLDITLGPTFWPAKGINTPMGITRAIRTELGPGHRFAVVEMGAYGEGSIKRLCDLTPPQAGIITGIGLCHLERFGSSEAIFRAKSELAQAIPQDGILVCNGDDSQARQMAIENRKETTLLYGFNDPNFDCYLSNLAIDSKGTSFTVTWKKKQYRGIVPLYGKTALSNVMAAFSMACALGADPEYVLGAIHNLDPINNRLEVQRASNQITVHDAYNSNPVGFKAAIDLVEELPAERRILMTPGMIELGNRQWAENEGVGRYAAKTCDLALVVGETNREPLIQGLKKGGMSSEQIIICPERETAFKELAKRRRDGDVVLIENDLTDLYEKPKAF